jgi:hypothetical protein
LLLLSVDEVPHANRTPDQRGEEKAGAKHLGFKMA